jgi:hypothetical protein
VYVESVVCNKKLNSCSVFAGKIHEEEKSIRTRSRRRRRKRRRRRRRRRSKCEYMLVKYCSEYQPM